MARVSVITPSYNQVRYLPEAIKSALDQNWNDLEIIIVDDCSTDGSFELCRTFEREYPGKVIILQNHKNLGVSETRNKGIEISSGEFLTFLDADDKWFPDKIHKQLDFLNDNADVGMVHSPVTILADDESKSWLTKNPNHLLQGVEQLEKFVNDFCKAAQGFSRLEYFQTLMNSNSICAASVIVRRDIFERAGPFNSDLPCQAEDWLQWLKLSMYAAIKTLPERLAMYRFHVENHTAKVFAHPNFDFVAIRDLIREKARSHDPKRFNQCLKECGRI